MENIMTKLELTVNELNLIFGASIENIRNQAVPQQEQFVETLTVN